MRYRLLLPIMALTLSCSFVTGLGSDLPGAGDFDFDAPADPMNVTVVLSEADSVSGMIPPEGGQLTLSSADGSVYTLEVPAGALDVATEILMTSVDSIEGTATGDGLFAVQLEPSGLRFKELVSLTITPAMDVSGDDLVFVKYEGNGEDLHLAVVDPFTEEMDVLLLDFSGIGYGARSAFGTIFMDPADYFRSDAKARLEQALGEASQRLAKEKTSAGKAKSRKQIESLLDEYRKKWVDKLLGSAQEDCQKVLEAEDALIELEAFRKRFSPDNPSPAGDKKARDALQKAKDKCPKAYRASGRLGPIVIKSALVCDIREFRLTQEADYMGCSSTVTFVGGATGTANSRLHGCRYGITGFYTGSYNVTLSADGKSGTVGGTTTGNMFTPFVGKGAAETATINLQLAETLKCK